MLWIYLLLITISVNGQCSVGEYKSRITGNCTQCPVGEYQNASNATKCHPCWFGQFQNQTGQTECLSCTSGQFSVPKSSNCTYNSTTCPYGTGGTTTGCEVCSPGQYQDQTNQFGCKTCSPGFFTRVLNSASCSQCDIGRFQTNSNSTNCNSCPEGWEQPRKNASLCTNCTNNWIRHNISCTTACPEQTFLNGGICESCPIGKQRFTNVTNVTCQDCPIGFFKGNNGTTPCTVCPEGFISNGTTTCTQCNETQIVVDNACQYCLVGQYSQRGCKVCPIGQFQDKVGQINCSVCSPGQYQDQTNQSMCKNCSLGQITIDYGTGCDYCSYKTHNNQFVSYGYNNTSSGCDRCLPGRVLDMTNSTTTGQCIECPVGEYQRGTTCVKCQPGFYQNKTGENECMACHNNTYTDKEGQSRCQTCNGTEETVYMGVGSYRCCPKNTCGFCGPGMIRNNDRCEPCPSGYFSIGQSLTCSLCPTGFISTNKRYDCDECGDGQRSVTNACENCPPGTYETGYVCKECRKGKYNDANGTTMCTSCPLPNTTTTTGQTNASACIPCKHPDKLDISTGECASCTEGKYSNEGVCLLCPLGYYQGDSSQVRCEQCDSGMTTLSKGSFACISCRSGNCECPPGQFGAGCAECEVGKWSSGGEECIKCTPRTYQNQRGQSMCKQCPMGQFSNEYELDSCKLCESGFYQPQIGQGSCFECPIGQYSKGASTVCELCDIGKSTNHTGSNSNGDCVPCVQGKYEDGRVCKLCHEGQYQNTTGNTTCRVCPDKQWSAPQSTNISDCFDMGSMTSYVFGNNKDTTDAKPFKTTCEIRPNFVLYCPGCTCVKDSRSGYWAGPFCNECQRGFASATCTAICPGYDGKHDSTICNGNGKCWFGREGNGLCYCGGGFNIDITGQNAFVDVRTCPRGHICPGYGTSSVDKAEYTPVYYDIKYRQYSTFVFKLSTYTPTRGHMMFKRFPPSKGHENSCNMCIGKYQNSLTTEVGFWSVNDEFNIFPPQAQSTNGFHGENCQYECAVCLNGGECVHSPHPFRYSYTILNTYVDQRRVVIPTTSCVCTSSVFDGSNMCCPNGFQPYVYYGRRNTDPYTRFDEVPFISSVDNDVGLGYYRDKDLWLEPTQDYQYYEPPSTNLTIAVGSNEVQSNYQQLGPYNKHIYHGTTREICRACPGLFSKGKRVQDTLIQTESEAEDYWWDYAASAGQQKCAGQGVCDFYAADREIDVNFMGNVNTWSLLHRGVLCRAQRLFDFTDKNTLEDCVKYANNAGARYVGFAPDSYSGGFDKKPAEAYSSKDSILKILVDGQAWVLSENKYYKLETLPLPDSDSEYKIHPFIQSRCTAYLTCDTFTSTNESYAFNVYDVTRGRGDDRFSRITDDVNYKSSYDRFDTCFTFTKDIPQKIGLYLTIGYEQGLDPFIGGLCPRGYFCTQTDDKRDVFNNGNPPVGYKEACPPGYYQPKYGMTRTDNNTRCNVGGNWGEEYEKKTNQCDSEIKYVRGELFKIETQENCDTAGLTNSGVAWTNSGCKVGSKFLCIKANPCQLNLATFIKNDYIDKICKRCPRHEWSTLGAYECNACRDGTIKKISGALDPSRITIFNMDILRAPFWFYMENEMGSQADDCAIVPPSTIHIPSLNNKMEETASLTQFLPLITCPYGFSNQPGTYIIENRKNWFLNNITTTDPFTSAPYIKNIGITSGVILNQPCECEIPIDSAIRYTTPSPNECLKYANTLTGSGGITAEKMYTTLFWSGCAKFPWSTNVFYNPVDYNGTTPRPDETHRPTSLQYICIKRTFNVLLTKELTAQYCFPCPGDSITGPESGICTTCTANLVKIHMKMALQKLVERSYPRLYRCFGNDHNDQKTSLSTGNPRYLDVVTNTTTTITTTSAPQDLLVRCNDIEKNETDLDLDVRYKEENIQAWQFKLDEKTLYTIEHIYWPITSITQTITKKVDLSVCILACSSTWGTEIKKHRNVRVGYAYKKQNRNFCVCNKGTNHTAYYRNVAVETADAHRLKYSDGNGDFNIIKKVHGNILWYQSQVEDGWVNETMPLCGKCAPGKKLVKPVCQDCGVGTYTSTVEEAMLATCKNCPTGYFQHLTGKVYCQKCNVGRAETRERQEECDICQPGYYEDERGQPSGTIVDSNGSPQPGGDTGLIQCKKCPVGKVQPDVERSYCNDCKVGKFQDTLADTSCKDCPSGWQQEIEAQSKCKECEVGKYQPGRGAELCRDCQAGQVQPEIEKTSCTDCAVGHYQNDIGKTECKSCIPTTCVSDDCQLSTEQNEAKSGNTHVGTQGFADDRGQTYCKQCLEGQTCKYDRAQTRCNPGSVQGKTVQGTVNGMIFTSSCQSCQATNKGDYFGVMKVSDVSAKNCISCTPPKNYPNQPAVECQKCGYLQHSWLSDGACTSCQDGKMIGPTAAKPCVTCPDGWHSNREDDQTCRLCPANHQSDNGICIACQTDYISTPPEKCKWSGVPLTFTVKNNLWSKNDGAFKTAAAKAGASSNCIVSDWLLYDNVICKASWQVKMKKTSAICVKVNTGNSGGEVGVYVTNDSWKTASIKDTYPGIERTGCTDWICDWMYQYNNLFVVDEWEDWEIYHYNSFTFFGLVGSGGKESSACGTKVYNKDEYATIHVLLYQSVNTVVPFDLTLNSVDESYTVIK